MLAAWFSNLRLKLSKRLNFWDRVLIGGICMILILAIAIAIGLRLNSIPYEVVDKWSIPGQYKGYGRTIVIDQKYKEPIEPLVKQLKLEARGSKFTYVYVFTDKNAAAMRKRDQHYVGIYIHNAYTGYDQFDAYEAE